ncbi:hypothetical protein P8605_04175 [Streptomyces sp. T-3]|nr:hypothetical protein [Streptomyces sp. T-3]
MRTLGVLCGIVVLAWQMAMVVQATTALSQQRGKRTLLELVVWRWATRRSAERIANLEAKIQDSDTATPPDRATLQFLRHEDVRFQASSRAFAIKWCVSSALSFAAGIALAAVMMVRPPVASQKPLAIVLFLAPIVTTMALNLFAMNPGMRRWTTDVVTASARRAHEALLVPFVVTGADPEVRREETSFHSPHIHAVRALEDFARALERYAVQRALPDGTNPMPKVVAHYAAAAAHVRELRDGLELDRDDGRKQALLGVEQMLKVLAGPRPQDLPTANVDTVGLLDIHHERRSRRRQMVILTVFTLLLAGLVAALVMSASTLGVTVAAAVTAFVVACWGQVLGLVPGRDGSGPRTG